MPTQTCAPTCGKMPIYKSHWRERFCVGWQNWKVRHIGKAIRVLCKALKEDPSFRQAWHSNIAMPIYDATRPKCSCVFDQGHEPHCQIVQAHDIPRRFELQDMSIEQANYIADKLMKHLFDC